jgi:N-glycosylase/DNA lyase
MPVTLKIPNPPDFSFRATVYSHGWCELAPFSIDVEKWQLSYVFSDGKAAVPGIIYKDKNNLRIDLANAKLKPERIIRDVRHVLRLDDDLRSFYNVLDGHDHLAWVAERRAGRLLRSPTVWEDLVKTMCTTNCSWALTKVMVNNLVDKLGIGAGRGKHAFPTPAAMAAMKEKFYRDEIRAGYRSPYFIELAEKVASGELDPESWLHSDLPTPELKKEMKKVKGVGDYAAENLLKLVGRYDGLALDSWLRSQFYKNYNKGRVCKDVKIERHYKRFGEWRGLVIWCDMTEKWIT